LKRPQFKISAEQLESIREEFLSVAEILPITTEAKARCKDPLDQKFIDLTLSCSPALLISKDKLVLRCARHLRPLGSNILPPEKAIAFLLEDN
jgi:PIN domain protein